MDKILSVLGIGWVKYALIGGVIILYSAGVYKFGYTNGSNIEKVNTLSLENKYNKKAVDLTNLQFSILTENIKALQQASQQFQEAQSKTNTIIKQINTETVKEIEKPMYKECVVSDEYFKTITKSIQELNRK